MSVPLSAPLSRVTVVTVTHHSEAVIESCLRSIDKIPVVVVDNASDDATCDRAQQVAPHALIIRNAQGVGYGNGANQGLAKVTSEFALLLNPDAVVQPGAVEKLIQAADRWPQVSLFGPLVYASNGKIEPSHNVLLWDRRRYGARKNESSIVGDTSVHHLSGAVVLVRMAAVHQIGGFDPRIFLYYEDDDFCLRLSQAGHRLLLVPAAKVSHVGGGSVRPSAHYYWEKFWHMAWSRLYFERKWHGQSAMLTLASRQFIGALGKALAHLVIFNRMKLWRDVARLCGTIGYLLGMSALRARS